MNTGFRLAVTVLFCFVCFGYRVRYVRVLGFDKSKNQLTGFLMVKSVL